MEHGAGVPFLREVVVFLVTAGVVVPLFQRLRISPILGFLLAGILIGPFGLGRLVADWPWLGYASISDIEGVSHLAELGVVFLLFMIGLELSLQRLWAMRRMVFGFGALQVVLTGAVITGLAMLDGFNGAAAVAIGSCLALSSTAIVTELLVERRRLASPPGRSAFSVLLFQDLAVVPILFVIGALGATSQDGLALSLLIAIGEAALAIIVILVAGRLVVRPFLRFVGASRNREVFTAAALLIILGTAVGTSFAGLSMALGAFLAGLVFSDTEFRHQIEADIEPFKGLFLGLFFVSVGMSIDPVFVISRPGEILALTLGLFVLKAVILMAIGLAIRLPVPIAVETALLLGQIGEFSLVGLGLARGLGVIDPDNAQLLVIVAGASMAITPVLIPYAERIGKWLEARSIRQNLGDGFDGGELTDHVIIAGFGRVGRLLGDILDHQKAAYVALDANGPIVAAQRKQGRPVYFGDTSRVDVLQRAGIEHAIAVVVTMDDPLAAENIVRAVRHEGHDVAIVARARDRAHAERLFALGANEVIPETVEASLQLGEVMLRGLGLPPDAARTIISERRDIERAALDGFRGTSDTHG
ncbi:monovalent cation:proton antiporter-2 (CPA2) family protein [Amorphus orientalis]|uniref:CPA2 family monovalent cation:H+ antiporter-2 n=1 Tax=Amorphus orientalis TaxID=649198 RepID=A0AAE3VRQ9_9HYPH|nr:monovalent cation:proton antiporter-2 (CPA2) family protein [Amorphus orientalis]MDQ0316928.1 CPA2 family monovalent cation:H+ antiporter-2 [Amorphus orientalis]